MGGYDSGAAALSAIFYHLIWELQQCKGLQSELHHANSSVNRITCNSLVPPFNGHGIHHITTSGSRPAR
jgi:hypothetical protein